MQWGETADLGNGVRVDLDDMRVVVGVEVLTSTRSSLSRVFGKNSTFMVLSFDLLDRLHPTLSYQLTRFQQAAEGTSSYAGRPVVNDT